MLLQQSVKVSQYNTEYNMKECHRFVMMFVFKKIADPCKLLKTTEPYRNKKITVPRRTFKNQPNRV